MPIVALIIWPLIAILLFVGLGTARGLIWTVVAGYLFLPEFALNPPGLPRYGKLEAIAIGALLGAAFTARRAGPKPDSDLLVRGLFLAFLALMLLTPIVTVMLNTTTLVFGETVIEALELWDYQNILLPTLAVIVPWLLARRYLHSPEHHRELLKALVLTGLAYSLLTLFELRMSPQLNNMFYGFFPHSWIQHQRGGGYRPLVFLRHGLWLGFFLLVVVLAAVAMMRASQKSRAFYLVSALWMLAVLMVSRNLGAAVLCLLFLPFAAVFTPKVQIKVAMIVAVLFMVNPLIRDFYIVPIQALADKVSTERGNSLRTRFDNETELLDRAALRPVVGWGPKSRWRVHDERGNDVTLSDGMWIIMLAQRGWLGFISFFGILILPILLLSRALKSRPVSNETSVLALIMGANLIYLIPNSALSPIGWLMAGALAGFVQFAPAAKRASSETPSERPDPGSKREMGASRPVYTRFEPDSQAPNRR